MDLSFPFIVWFLIGVQQPWMYFQVLRPCIYAINVNYAQILGV